MSLYTDHVSLFDESARRAMQDLPQTPQPRKAELRGRDPTQIGAVFGRRGVDRNSVASRFPRRENDIDHLTFAPVGVMRSDDDGSEPWVENRDRSGGRPVEAMKRQAISPDRCPAFDHDQRPTRNVRQRRQRFTIESMSIKVRSRSSCLRRLSIPANGTRTLPAYCGKKARWAKSRPLNGESLRPARRRASD